MFILSYAIDADYGELLLFVGEHDRVNGDDWQSLVRMRWQKYIAVKPLLDLTSWP